MSQFTIIVDDGRMAVNGEGYTIDLAELAEQGIHAVQFYGEYGEIEYKPKFNAELKRIEKPMNEIFTAAMDFERELNRWHDAKAEAEIKAAEQLAAQVQQVTVE